MNDIQFAVDYNNEKLVLFYYDKMFIWDLNECDINNFWDSFEYNGDFKDVNMYREDENTDPVMLIYDTVWNQHNEIYLRIDKHNEANLYKIFGV